MKAIDVLEYTFSNFSNNKFKTIMSSLGIIIGVMAIVVMLTLGDGLYSGFSQQFGNLDLDQIIVAPGGNAGGGGMIGNGGHVSQKPPAQLTDRDVRLLMGTQGVVEVNPRVSDYGVVSYDNQNRSLAIQGIYPSSEKELSATVDKGRFLSQSDIYSVVIGSKVANGTFNKVLRPGSVITISSPYGNKSHQYTVVGVLKESNGSVLSGDSNSNIYMATAGINGFSSFDSYSAIYVRASSPDTVEDTANNVKDSMNKLHRNDAFQVETMKSFSDAITTVFNYIKYIMGGIAAISLVVGGIGILNVMMLTVKERTKEIGLMKAVGATTGNVRLLFLAESSMLGIVSGVIGLAIAFGVSAVIGSYAGTPMPVSITNILIGLGFGFLTTTIAGVYPANQAAKLDPIEALRTE